jgi:hypothetical protein
MAAATAVALWCHYNAILLRQARRRGFPLVDFDVPEAAYIDRVGEVAAQLGLGAQAMRDDPFFTGELRTAQQNPASQPLPWRARLLHWRLRERARRRLRSPRTPVSSI